MKKIKIALSIILLLCVVVLLMLALSGCARQTSSIPINERWGNVESKQLNESRAGEQFFFQVNVDDRLIAEGVPIKINVSGQVNSGSLRFELRSPDGTPVWNSGVIKTGDFSIKTGYTLQIGQTGTYSLGLVFSNNTSATYNLSWQTLKLGGVALLPGIGMIFVAIGAIVFAAWRKILNWRYLGFGALFWVLSVVIKSAFAFLANPTVLRALGASPTTLFAPGNILSYLYIGSLTGIFEVGLVWLILRKNRLGKATKSQALVFGIGFGSIEALVLGLTSNVYALIGILAPDEIPLSTLSSLVNNSTFLMGLAPIIERLFIIIAHTFACLLIFHAINSREIKWGWLAILYKTLLDTPGGFAAFWNANTVGKIWALEIMIAFLGLIGLWGIWRVSRNYPQLITKSEKL